MPEPESRRSTEGLSRLIAFADAVVAIALTLLVLPLVDIAGELREDTTVVDVVSGKSIELASFAVSFIVIWILWRQHHQMMEYFRAYDRVLVNLHFVWLLTIVMLPFATALVAGEHIDEANVVYIVVLAVSVSALVGMSRWALRHRELLVDDEETERWARAPGGFGTLLILALALIVAVIFPHLGTAPLFLLVLTDPVEAWIRRLRT